MILHQDTWIYQLERKGIHSMSRSQPCKCKIARRFSHWFRYQLGMEEQDRYHWDNMNQLQDKLQRVVMGEENNDMSFVVLLER